MSRVLYWVNGSMWSWQVAVVLHEKQLGYEGRRLRVMGRRDTREPSFLALNPRGDAPVLVEPDGTVVVESMAITHFLERRYPQPALLPTEAAGLALVLGRAYEVERLRRAYRPLERLFRDGPSAGPDTRATIARAPAAVDEELAVWERYVAASPFLAGDTFSLADAVFYPALAYQVRRGLRLADGSALAEYRRRLETRASVQATRPEGWERPAKRNLFDEARALIARASDG